MRRASLAGLGLGLFLVSFAGANPPGAVSDEPDQYIKAIAAGHLDVFGTKVNNEQARSMDYWLPVVNTDLTSPPAFAQFARAYVIPSSLDPRYLGCTVEGPLATCLDRSTPPIPGPTETVVSSVGTYQPFLFVPAGLVMRLASATVAALLMGRLTFTLICALLLLGALLVAVRARPGPVSIASVALCIAPTSFLVMSTLSSSGPESAAGVAWWVALLSATEEGSQRAAWWLALASGGVLGLARSTGPVWMVLIALVVILYRGGRPFWRAFRSGGSLAIAAVTVCAAAGAATLVWQVAVQPSYQVAIVPTLSNVSPAMISFILNRAVDTIGWGEATPLSLVTQIWELMVAAVVVLGVASAVARGAPRQVAALLAISVAAVASIAAFLAFGSHAGDIQGRWFIAPLAGVPILSGWMAGVMPAGTRSARASRLVSCVIAVGVTVCLGVSWWYNEYRYAVDGGSWFFLGHSLWQPILGWAPWLVCAALGLLALLLAGLSGGNETGQTKLAGP